MVRSCSWSRRRWMSMRAFQAHKDDGSTYMLGIAILTECFNLLKYRLGEFMGGDGAGAGDDDAIGASPAWEDYENLEALAQMLERRNMKTWEAGSEFVPSLAACALRPVLFGETNEYDDEDAA